MSSDVSYLSVAVKTSQMTNVNQIKNIVVL